MKSTRENTLIEYSFTKSPKPKLCLACGKDLIWHLPSPANHYCTDKLCVDCRRKEDELAKTFQIEPVMIKLNGDGNNAELILQALKQIRKMRLPSQEILPDKVRIRTITLPIRLLREVMTELKGMPFSVHYSNNSIHIWYQRNGINGQLELKSIKDGEHKGHSFVFTDEDNPDNSQLDLISNRVPIKLC